MTGLRRGELRQLQWGDLRLDALPAFIQLRATTTKNGRDDVLPMHPELVTLFRGMMAGHPKAKVFAAIPTMKCFRNDLRKAGIPHDTGLCFHSLRHTFCTRLVRSGTTLKAAQQLMRHSTVELTAKVYTHLGITDTASALHGLTLPTLPTAQVMTGTDNLSPPSLPTDAPNHAPLMHQTPRVSVRFGAQSHNSNLLDDPTGESEKPPMDTRKTPMDIDNFNTAGDGTRTPHNQPRSLDDAVCQAAQRFMSAMIQLPHDGVESKGVVMIPHTQSPAPTAQQ